MNLNNGIPNWLIKPLLALEKTAPGVYALFGSASGAQKNVMAAAAAFLLSRHVDTSDCNLKKAATCFQTAKPIDLLTFCSGSPLPNKYLSLVRKRPGYVQDAQFYLALHAWLSRGPAPEKLNALLHLERFTLATLEAIDILDPIAISPLTLAFIPNAKNARIFNAHLRFLRAVYPLVTSSELKRYVKDIGREFRDAFRKFDQRQDWFAKPTDLPIRFLGKVIFPEPPFSCCKHLVPICSAGKMVQIARKYRNCLRNKIIDVLIGDSFYAIWLGDEPGFILEFANDRPAGWRLSSVNSFSNEEIGFSAAASAIRHVERLGIPYLPSWQTGLWDDVDSLGPQHFRRSWRDISNHLDQVNASVGSQ